MTQSEVDARFMKQALALGRRGMGRCWPNPAVGCVIVREGRVVGRGWTAPGGRPHAEPQALAQAGENARGATAYVTLEPCAHFGQTPPCAQALIAAGVSRVVAAVRDTDPRVSGKGFAQLRTAGIAVTTGVSAQEAALDLAGFFLRVEHGRPWLTLKLATSLDGRIATANGESKWITGAEARRRVHADRLRHDAVMVGAGTARADDPSLTVRGLGATHQPVRVVVAKDLAIPRHSTLAHTAQTVPVWLVHGPGAPPDATAFWDGTGARRLPVMTTSPQEVMRALGAAGLTRVYCEGGGTLAASFLSAGMVDEIHLYTAGKLLGGDGTPGIAALGLDRLADAPRFDLVAQSRVGEDLRTVWRRHADW